MFELWPCNCRLLRSRITQGCARYPTSWISGAYFSYQRSSIIYLIYNEPPRDLSAESRMKGSVTAHVLLGMVEVCHLLGDAGKFLSLDSVESCFVISASRLPHVCHAYAPTPPTRPPLLSYLQSCYQTRPRPRKPIRCATTSRRRLLFRRCHPIGSSNEMNTQSIGTYPGIGSRTSSTAYSVSLVWAMRT